MEKEKIIEKCYDILRRETPLRFDCGKLCGGFCCKGDENTGMILFAGEEKFLDPSIKIKENDGVKYAVCNGSCNRNKRPLSCRIYPLFPYIKEKNEKKYIEVGLDFRAKCPLTSCEYKFNRRFVKTVGRAGKYLLLNEETAEPLFEISEASRECEELRKLLK